MTGRSTWLAHLIYWARVAAGLGTVAAVAGVDVGCRSDASRSEVERAESQARATAAQPGSVDVLAAMLYSVEMGSDRAAPATGRQLIVVAQGAADLWDWIARCTSRGPSLDLECVADWRVTVWFLGYVFEEVGIRTRSPCADRVVVAGRWYGPCPGAEAELGRAVARARWYHQCSVELPSGIGQAELGTSRDGSVLLAPWSWFRQQPALVVAAEVAWTGGRCRAAGCVVSGRERTELARQSGVLAGLTEAMFRDGRLRIAACSVVCPPDAALADESATCKMELQLTANDRRSLEAVAADLFLRGLRAEFADSGEVHTADVLVPDLGACDDLRRWAAGMRRR